MTQNEKLDKILFGLKTAKLKTDVFEQTSSGYMMSYVCKDILNLPLENGEEKILEGILLANEHIEYINPEAKIIVNISSKGIDFINKGGYKQLEKDNIIKQKKEELEMKLINSNITINKWSKYGISISILISIIALAVSIISLLKDNH